MTAYAGLQILVEAMNAAGTVDLEKVQRRRRQDGQAAADLRDRLRRASSTSKFQNIRAFPTVIQWQDGKMVTVFPRRAAGENRRSSRRPARRPRRDPRGGRSAAAAAS